MLTGSILGLVVSYFSYRQYYPALDSPQSHRCYSPRRPGKMLDQDVPNGPAAPDPGEDAPQTQTYRDGSDEEVTEIPLVQTPPHLPPVKHVPTIS